MTALAGAAPSVQPVLARPSTIVAAALALRVVWALAVPVDPVSDSFLYDAFAKSIAAGRGYAFPAGDLTAYWPVGAPAVYAVIYFIFGSGGLAVPMFQALLGAAMVALTWRLAHLALGDKVAAPAGWLVAIWPLLIQFTTILASELIFTVLLLAALNVWTARGWAPALRAVLWGACIAAANYVRPTAWPLLLFFPVLLWRLEQGPRRAATILLASVLAAVCVFAPWVYRNYQVFGGFVLVATNSGPNLWMGNNPASNGGYMALPDKPFANELERDRYFAHEAFGYIATNPLGYMRLATRRAVTTYDRETIGVVWNESALARRFGAACLQPLKLLSTAYWWLMLTLGLAGAVLALGAGLGPRLWPLLATAAWFAALPILTVAQDRYHVPIDPILAIFASYALVALSRRLFSRWRN